MQLIKIHVTYKLAIIIFLIFLSHVLLVYWEFNAGNILVRLCSLPGILAFLLMFNIILTYKSGNIFKKIILYTILLLLGYFAYYYLEIFLFIELPK